TPRREGGREAPAWRGSRWGASKGKKKMTFIHLLAKCQKKKERRRHLLLLLPCLGSLDVSPRVKRTVERLHHGEAWVGGLLRQRKKKALQHSLAKCQKKKKNRRYIMRPCPRLGPLDGVPGARG